MAKENKTPEIPEDLGLKFGTEDEEYWTKLKESIEKNLKNHKREILIDEHMLKFVEQKIKEEQKNIQPPNYMQ